MDAPPDTPDLSVVVICDHVEPEQACWAQLRRTLNGLAQQDFDGDVEFLYVESDDRTGRIPSDVPGILPQLRIVSDRESSHTALKNRGAEAASAPIVAFIDGDCVPCVGWLRRAGQVIDCYEGAAVVTGRTTYPPRNVLYRIWSLLARSTEDPGHDGETRYLSLNNAVYRRDAYLGAPLLPDKSVARAQSEAIMRHGGRLYFDASLSVEHDLEGWREEAAFRHRMGYGAVRVRMLDRQVPKAWLTHLGYAAIPFYLAASLRNSWRNCLRCGSRYGVRGFELPLAFAVAVVCGVLEIPGMVRAISGRPSAALGFR